MLARGILLDSPGTINSHLSTPGNFELSLRKDILSQEEEQGGPTI